MGALFDFQQRKSKKKGVCSLRCHSRLLGLYEGSASFVLDHSREGGLKLGRFRYQLVLTK